METRVVLVAGSSGTLGAAVVRRLAPEGVRLALVARHEEPLGALAAELGLEGERVLCLAADLADPVQTTGAVEAVLARWGRLDAVVDLVGTWSGGTKVADLSDAQWHDMLTTNLHTALHLSRAALPTMLEQGKGALVFVGARAVERPGSGQAPYNVSKAGLVALARSIGADYAREGIRANVVLPSTIVPDGPADHGEGEPRIRVAAGDLAEMIALLCSDAGRALNGAVIPVYGGRAI